MHTPQTGYHQSWSTGWNKTWLNRSTMGIDLTTHRTMIVRSTMQLHHAPILNDNEKKEKVFFNIKDTLRLYGVGYNAKNHSDSDRGNCWHYMGYSFPINSKYRYHPTDMISHTTPLLHQPLAGTRSSSMGPPWRTDRTTHLERSAILFKLYNIIHVQDGATFCDNSSVIQDGSV